MTDISYKRADTVPIEATLPVDLTEAAGVTFTMYDGDEIEVEGAVNIGKPEDGVVAYEWDENETYREGLFTIEWEVAFPDGDGGTDTETFPKNGRDTIYFYN